LGWIVWFIIVARRGQTPGKQLLGMYIIRDDGTRAGGGRTWLREFLVKSLLFGILTTLPLILVELVWWSTPDFGSPEYYPRTALSQFVIALPGAWLLWDRRRQCLWDKVAHTHVGYSPNGYRPLTGAELWRAGGAAPTPPPTPTQQAADQLRELKRLLDEGLITADEYEQRRLRLVERL
jgi:uncharacterized RDD family membrane protein YckC